MSYKKGTCNNCERPERYLPSSGRCWMCYDAVRKAQQSGESVEAALAVIKERVKSGVKLKSKYRSKKAPVSEGPEKTERKPVAYKTGKERPIQGGNVVSLEFRDERDKKMLAVIAVLAAEYRRSPEQEIMWILQHYIDAAAEEPKGPGHD